MSIEYSNHVTDLRGEIIDFADRLKNALKSATKKPVWNAFGKSKDIKQWESAIAELHNWAEPEPPVMSGSQWSGRMLELIEILRGLGLLMDELRHWDEGIGKELRDKGKTLMKLAAKLSTPDDLLTTGKPTESEQQPTQIDTATRAKKDTIGIGRIIDLVKHIADVLTKSDFLPAKEQHQLESYQSCELKIGAINDCRRLRHQSPLSGDEQRQIESEYNYDQNKASTLKCKRKQAQAEHIKSTLRPLQEELDLYLAPRWSEILTLKTWAYPLKKEIEYFINADLGAVYDITGKVEKVERELNRIKAKLELEGQQQQPVVQKPAGVKQSKKKTKKAEKSQKRFQPWTKSGDACFVIENNRVKFHYNNEIKDLKLKSESNTHRLLLLIRCGSLQPSEIKAEICPNTTNKASKVVDYANQLLNEKIAAVGFMGVPPNVEFIERDK